MNKGFIAIEGIDGSGKSTQMRLLAEKLYAKSIKIYQTCEPTESRIGTIIRDILNHKIVGDHRTIAGLFVADRLDHLLNKKDGLLKKLEVGYFVITDRYYFSSYAYQGCHMSMDWVIKANSLSAELLRPDLNIFIDVPPDICMKRINGNRNSTEMYETLENLKNVSTQYFKAFELLKGEEKVKIIDGNRSPELIAEDIWKEVSVIADKISH